MYSKYQVKPVFCEEVTEIAIVIFVDGEKHLPKITLFYI